MNLQKITSTSNHSWLHKLHHSEVKYNRNTGGNEDNFYDSPDKQHNSKKNDAHWYKDKSSNCSNNQIKINASVYNTPQHSTVPSTANTSIIADPPKMIYKRNVIKPNNNLNNGKIINNCPPKESDALKPPTIARSSSTGDFNNEMKQQMNMINIEDLLLLEEQFKDVWICLNTKSSNWFNECFEWINFYNNSSLYNQFENYFLGEEAKSSIHTAINVFVFSLILLYDISFDRDYLEVIHQHIFDVISLNHKSYLILCEYILSKISSAAKTNLWVIKLKEMLNNKLEHIDISNKDYMSYTMNNNQFGVCLPQAISEIKYHCSQISKYIRVILKNYNYSANISEFTFLFKAISTISTDDINAFYRKSVIRVTNKNASVWGSDILPNESLCYNVKEPFWTNKSIKKFTLVLDWDETWISFKIDPKDDKKGILRFRPFWDDFLDIVNQYYEIVIFTAGTKDYADPIVNAIEQNKIYFDYRLYRQHTTVCNNDFVKDISKIGRELSKIIIVDNMPQNFRLQKENGIFIKAFWGEDAEDRALYYLGYILEGVAKEYEDVREGLNAYKNEILNKVSSNILRNSTNIGEN